MADLTQDVRSKLDDEEHRLFDVFTRARGESMAERIRLLIREFNAKESHEHTCAAACCEARASAGNARGMTNDPPQRGRHV